MDYFNLKRNRLFCEDVEVEYLAKKYGTPLYIYSWRTFIEHFRKFQTAFKPLNPLICYSVKANSNLTILNSLVRSGSGLDIVSGGELYRAKRIGCDGKKIVYASVGKTEREIRDALDYGIYMFNVESIPELELINKVATASKKKARVALRINPDINPNTHSYITTGKKETKFGIDFKLAEEVFLNKQKFTWLIIEGIHVHIGSQITEVDPFVKTIKKILQFIDKLRSKKVLIKTFNIGGGMGIIYDLEKAKAPKEFASKIVPLLKNKKLKIIFEPGRFIIGNAGILVTKIIYIKRSWGKKFVVVDAAMNDLIRPSLYGAYHKIRPIVEISSKKSEHRELVDIVGPVCESGDFLGKKRDLPNVKQNDFLAVMSAGAYSFSMASNYNSRVKPAQVLVKGKKTHLIGKRQEYKDLIDKELLVKKV